MARKLKDYPSVSLLPENLDGPIDFVRLFGRPAPVHIEIGCGKGTFLLNQARNNPEVNFLGIEWARKYYRFAVDRIGRWALTNVRIIRTDAAHLFADFVPTDSVSCFHVYFPDPWPKKRHNKRRFFSPANLDNVMRSLKTGGIIKIATDYLEYFQVITALLETNKGRLEQVDFVPATGADQGEWVGTNFERKYIDQKRPIYTIAVSKT
jgi:tRNA (guanine-N7-)-methyltransferase